METTQSELVSTRNSFFYACGLCDSSISSIPLSIDGLPKLDNDLITRVNQRAFLYRKSSTSTYLIRRQGPVEDEAPICGIVIVLFITFEHWS